MVTRCDSAGGRLPDEGRQATYDAIKRLGLTNSLKQARGWDLRSTVRYRAIPVVAKWSSVRQIAKARGSVNAQGRDSAPSHNCQSV